MADVLAFYAQPGALTEPGRHGELLGALPDELEALAEIVSRTGIYDVVAPDFYGIEVPPVRAQEIHLRGVDGMLAGALALEDAPLERHRPPERRLFCRCAGFTRLLVAALRAHGVPARARCGFAAYFNPGRFEDHWVAEVWDAQRWRLVDAQLDEVWRARLDLHDDHLDLPRDRFLVAADAWKRCRADQDDPYRAHFARGDDRQHTDRTGALDHDSIARAEIADLLRPLEGPHRGGERLSQRYEPERHIIGQAIELRARKHIEIDILHLCPAAP